MARREELTDEQWAILEPLIPETPRRDDGRGRPELHSNRAVMNGILWVLRTGAAWCDLPDRFPSGTTCFRRFSRWVKNGVLRQILEALAQHLEEVGQIIFLNALLTARLCWQKRGPKVGKTKRGKGTKLMVIADATGLLLGVHTSSASPYEVTLVEATLDEIVTVGRPERIIGDRAYDSDPLDQRLAAKGIELITPHKSNRKRAFTQDGRALRRYRRRWKIERLFGWLNAFKRVLTRWERCADHYTGFVHLAFSVILMRRYL
jgi:transposase